MTDVIAHRGPDDSGIWWNEEHRIGLGHRRLSIIDLSPLGHQPMFSADGTKAIVFNGEIYNFLDVRSELESLGYTFRSHSDTEVILSAYAEWGDACVAKLNGMFAFALWDEPQKRLFLSRDRLGVKPLYYWWNGTSLVFASEIKAILASGIVPTVLNEEALDLYLGLQYVPGSMTMFQGVRKLLPGHHLVVEHGSLREIQYWSAPYGETMEDRGLQYHADEFRALVNDATRIRMISDVPIGAFLSGGVDSSVVVSIMAGLSSIPVRTYSVGFEEGGKHYDELEYAKIVSDAFKTEHRVVVCNSAEAAREIPRLIWQLDEPVNESLIYPYNKVSRLAKQTASVVLTGEGADEFLHGYRFYSVLNKYEAAADMIPRSLREAAMGILGRFDLVRDSRLRVFAALLQSTPGRRVVQWETFFSAQERHLLRNGKGGLDLASYILDAPPSTMDAKLTPSFVDHRYRMVDYILMRTDKMSMETALECRSPFLDYRVVNYMVKLPRHYKNPNGVSKFLLRKAFEGNLPRSILERKKKPFAAPIRVWLGALASKYLADSRLASDGILNLKQMQRYAGFDSEGNALHPEKLWLLVMLEIWYSTYFGNGRNHSVQTDISHGSV